MECKFIPETDPCPLETLRGYQILNFVSKLEVAEKNQCEVWYMYLGRSHPESQFPVAGRKQTLLFRGSILASSGFPKATVRPSLTQFWGSSGSFHSFSSIHYMLRVPACIVEQKRTLKEHYARFSFLSYLKDGRKKLNIWVEFGDVGRLRVAL